MALSGWLTTDAATALLAFVPHLDSQPTTRAWTAQIATTVVTTPKKVFQMVLSAVFTGTPKISVGDEAVAGYADQFPSVGVLEEPTVRSRFSGDLASAATIVDDLATGVAGDVAGITKGAILLQLGVGTRGREQHQRGNKNFLHDWQSPVVVCKCHRELAMAIANSKSFEVGPID